MSAAQEFQLTAPEPEALAPIGVATPQELLRIAVSQNADVDKLRQLMDLQERWEKNQARMAFVQAMSSFKAHSIVVLKDKTNTQYNSKYVSLGNLVSTVTPFLSKHNLSVSWDIDQSSGIKVTAIVRHSLGHSESVSMVVPPDDSGKKNPIQQIKAAITYAKACTFESICGLASTDANVDDDGNSVTMGELSERLDWIDNCRNEEELRSVFAGAYKEAKAANDQGALKALIAAKDKKRKEFAA